jgi:hypothetical protein
MLLIFAISKINSNDKNIKEKINLFFFVLFLNKKKFNYTEKIKRNIFYHSFDKIIF